jgi:hypothetical protein
VPKHPQYRSVCYVYDPNPEGTDIANLHYKVTGIPTDFVIDTREIIVASDVCGTCGDLTTAVNSALAEM